MRVASGLVGRDRYVLRWLKGRPYLYLREYLGAAGHARPRLRDVYLGAVPLSLVRAGGARLSAYAFRLRGRLVALLVREGRRQLRAARRRRRR
ncbi:MAG: hypothetical protein ACREKH_17165 [Candidatus Rokuibacteriota bacterium]